MQNTNNQPNTFSRVIGFLYRTQIELVSALVIATLVILTQYGSRIMQILDSNGGGDEVLKQTAGQFIRTQLKELSDLPFANTIGIVLIWSAAAVLLYISFVLLSNLVISIRNEIALDTQDYNRRRHYLEQRIALKAVTLLVFYGLVALSLKFLVPYFINIAGQFVTQQLALSAVYLLLYGIIGLALTIYVIWVTAKLVFAYEKTL